VPTPPPESKDEPRGPEHWPSGFALMAGWLPAGRVLLRLDIAERVAGELGHLTRRSAAPLPEALASRLGLKADTLEDALTAMGFRLLPAETLEEAQFGPPAPARIAAARAERAPRQPRREARPNAEAPAPRGEMFGPPVPAEIRKRFYIEKARAERAKTADATDTKVIPIPPLPAAKEPAARPPQREAKRVIVIPPLPAAPVAPERDRDRDRDRDRGRIAIPPMPEGGRGDGPRPAFARTDRDGPGGDRPRGDRPRGDRPRQDGPPRGRDDRREPAPREIFAGAKGDNPFAVLAALKLKKD
jgi:ATP-dependent RNA helicase SUPV3L1/SUV3